MRGLASWWTVALLLPVLVAADPVSASASALCWLNYSRVSYTQIHGSLETDYGRILRQLGSGTSGSVSLVLRHADNATVAVKRFSSPATNSLSQQVQLEFHIGTLLNGHSGIAKTYDLLWEEVSSNWLIVTEFCPRSFTKERPSIPSESLDSIFRKIMMAVDYMHSQGISHGDLKIENILLTADGWPKIIDFGASTYSGCLTETPGLADLVNVVPGDYGTTAYLPPEVFSHLEYDKQKADIWALGILFYVIVTGSVPWSLASIENHRYQAFVTEGKLSADPICATVDSLPKLQTCSSGLLSILQNLPRGSRDMVFSMLSPDPQDRPSLNLLLR